MEEEKEVEREVRDEELARERGLLFHSRQVSVSCPMEDLEQPSSHQLRNGKLMIDFTTEERLCSFTSMVCDHMFICPMLPPSFTYERNALGNGEE